MKHINFYLIRHGETEWNLANRMQGSKNSPLTEKGILEAKRTGEFLAHTPFIAAYSSTQPRAIETRDYILSERDPTLTPVPCGELNALCEMDFGQWEGQSIEQLKRNTAFQDYLYFPAKFDPSQNQGEHYIDVILRMQSALRELAQTHSSGNILIVTHGASLRLLLHAIKGESWLSHRNEKKSTRIDNASISIVTYQQQSEADEEGRFDLAQYNDTQHLLSAHGKK